MDTGRRHKAAIDGPARTIHHVLAEPCATASRRAAFEVLRCAAGGTS